MRRFWVPSSCVSSSSVTFTDESFHHLVTVSRANVGDHIEVLCGDGTAYEVNITVIEKRRAQGDIVGRRPLAEEKKPLINLAVCMPKPATFEWVLEKSVELGVHSVQPLFNDNSFFKAEKDIKDNKWPRWQKIIQSATEQSGRARLMQLQAPVTLNELATRIINRKSGVLGLFLFEGEGVLDIQSFLRSRIRDAGGTPPDEVWALIGSEGGFSPREVANLKELGLQPLTVGPQILRVETACVAIMSVIKYEFGLMA